MKWKNKINIALHIMDIIFHIFVFIYFAWRAIEAETTNILLKNLFVAIVIIILLVKLIFFTRKKRFKEVA